MPTLDNVLNHAPGSTALLGVAGSHAFGLAHSDSDVDYRGCYVAPTRDLFRLITPPESFVHTKPDVSMHEVGKLLRLAVAANPTALETLFYSEYVIQSPIGEVLLANRDQFLTDKIRDTHLGFAKSQFEKLKKRYVSSDAEDRRVRKHARHTLRVIRLTEKVLTTGIYDLRVDDPDEIFAFGDLDMLEMVFQAQDEVARIESLPSVLPPGPNLAAINDLLILIREGYFNE
jgi:hypothetical protein